MLDSNNTGTSEGTVILLSGLNNPNGIAWHNGSLYVAEINKITRYDDADAFVIANKVRHRQASFANHYSSRRVMLRWFYDYCCDACYARQQSVRMKTDVRPPHCVGSVEILLASAASMLCFVRHRIFELHSWHALYLREAPHMSRSALTPLMCCAAL